jgi:hypothetical protein
MVRSYRLATKVMKYSLDIDVAVLWYQLATAPTFWLRFETAIRDQFR